MTEQTKRFEDAVERMTAGIEEHGANFMAEVYAYARLLSDAACVVLDADADGVHTNPAGAGWFRIGTEHLDNLRATVGLTRAVHRTPIGPDNGPSAPRTRTDRWSFRNLGASMADRVASAEADARLLSDAERVLDEAGTGHTDPNGALWLRVDAQHVDNLRGSVRRARGLRGIPRESGRRVP